MEWRQGDGAQGRWGGRALPLAGRCRGRRQQRQAQAVSVRPRAWLGAGEGQMISGRAFAFPALAPAAGEGLLLCSTETPLLILISLLALSWLSPPAHKKPCLPRLCVAMAGGGLIILPKKRWVRTRRGLLPRHRCPHTRPKRSLAGCVFDLCCAGGGKGLLDAGLADGVHVDRDLSTTTPMKRTSQRPRVARHVG